MSEVAFVYHPGCLLHDTGDHPESADRLAAVRQAVREADFPFLRWVQPNPATEEQVGRVHDLEFLKGLRDLAASGGGQTDLDTVVGPDSLDAALLAAGGAARAVELALSGDFDHAFAAVRPPGHHAGPASSAGFCLLNNVAIAAQHARSTFGLKKVLIVDFDGHHGNGTQAIFEADPGVLPLSIHAAPYYPGTGSVREVGRGAGAGYTVNVPVPYGTGDQEYARIFAEIVGPVARQYEPELVLVSAGYDAHWRDPLVPLGVTTRGFAWMTDELVRLAEELCGGRLVLVLEGGYDLEALGASVVASLAVLGGAEAVDPLGAGFQSREVDLDPVLVAVRRAHPLWFSEPTR